MCDIMGDVWCVICVMCVMCAMCVMCVMCDVRLFFDNDVMFVMFVFVSRNYD